MTIAPAPMATHRGSAYFFVSYAHRPPSVRRETEPALAFHAPDDSTVRTFFTDLLTEVRRLARPDAGPVIGLFDQSVRPGADWKTAVEEGLAKAEVLVPLYSPRYVTSAWPRGELSTFRARLRGRAATGHIQPVLWLPVPPGQALPALPEAADIDFDIPFYRSDGLKAMQELSFLRDGYLTVLSRLAQRIVDVAERSPLGPSPVTPLRTQASLARGRAHFLIAVLAPTTAALPDGRASDSYGARPSQWRPYSSRAAIAEQAADICARLDLTSEVVDAPWTNTEVGDQPGVLLVDPQVIRSPSGRESLDASLRALPKWMTAVIVRDEPALTQDVYRISRNAHEHVTTVDNFADFGEVLPKILVSARSRRIHELPNRFAGRPRFHPNPTSALAIESAGDTQR